MKVGNQPFSRTLSYPLIHRFNVIAHIHKLHNIKQSLECNLEQAEKVFKTLIDTYEKVAA